MDRFFFSFLFSISGGFGLWLPQDWLGDWGDWGGLFRGLDIPINHGWFGIL